MASRTVGINYHRDMSGHDEKLAKQKAREQAVIMAVSMAGSPKLNESKQTKEYMRAILAVDVVRATVPVSRENRQDPPEKGRGSKPIAVKASILCNLIRSHGHFANYRNGLLLVARSAADGGVPKAGLKFRELPVSTKAVRAWLEGDKVGAPVHSADEYGHEDYADAV